MLNANFMTHLSSSKLGKETKHQCSIEIVAYAQFTLPSREYDFEPLHICYQFFKQLTKTMEG